MVNSISNRNLMNAVLNGKSFTITLEIDQTYGQWTESFIPYKNGYRNIVGGASNWTYCPVCGQAAGQCGCNCDCDQHDYSQYKFLTNHDMFLELKKARNNGALIIF